MLQVDIVLILENHNKKHCKIIKHHDFPVISPHGQMNCQICQLVASWAVWSFVDWASLGGSFKKKGNNLNTWHLGDSSQAPNETQTAESHDWVGRLDLDL